ncbi:unnamed protein product [Bemisia tabaci]|uniref:Uncharacterized protein n=1 Tax=Bemisia tabaci TaxID=7038 RepID=A0A9P0A2N1_BEMTA|nr:unnamed protein product [Bemisia tabaci]
MNPLARWDDESIIVEHSKEIVMDEAKKRERDRDRKRKYREKLVLNNPDKVLQTKLKNKKYYQARSSKGLLKTVNKMSDEEKFAKRQMWKNQKQRQRLRKSQEVHKIPVVNDDSVLNESNSEFESLGADPLYSAVDVCAIVGPSEIVSCSAPPPPSLNSSPNTTCRSIGPTPVFQNSVRESIALSATTSCPSNLVNSKTPSRQLILGKKIARRNRDKLLGRIKILEQQVHFYKRLSQKYKKRWQRAVRKRVSQNQSNQSSQTDSPQKVVRQIISAGKEEVKRQLLFGQALEKQLRKNSRECKNLVQKRNFAKSIGGMVCKKYGMEKELQRRKISSYYLRKKYGGKVMSIGSKLKRSSKFVKLKSTVMHFFEDDEVSVMTPGKKQYITRRKVQKQRRFLRDSLKNLHKKFVEKYDVKVGYVTFLKLKPFWVVPPKESDRNTCRCAKHANFELILKPLIRQKYLRNVRSVSELVAKVSCKADSKFCMFGECKKCNVKIVPSSVIDQTIIKSSHLIPYDQWIKKKLSEVTSNSGVSKITVKEKKRDTGENLIEIINERLPLFLKHVYTDYHQKVFFKDIVKQTRGNECVIIIDWSQNFATKYDEEVQSRHFGASQQQVSLHTGVVYLKGGEKQISFCTVSDCCRHDAPAIWAHLGPVLDMLKKDYEAIEIIHFFSDGPTTQYRNKYNFFLFQKCCIERNFYQATWNFSEPGHGKGAADGVGGTVKRTAEFAVHCRKFDVIDAKTFVEATSSLKILTFIIPQQDIEEVEASLPASLKTVPDTMSLRQLTWCRNKVDELDSPLVILEERNEINEKVQSVSSTPAPERTTKGKKKPKSKIRTENSDMPNTNEELQLAPASSNPAPKKTTQRKRKPKSQIE